MEGKLRSNRIGYVTNFCSNEITLVRSDKERPNDIASIQTPPPLMQNILSLYRINKKCIGDSVFDAAAPRLWNELPVNIRASGKLPMFRKYVKTYLFIRHFN